MRLKENTYDLPNLLNSGMPEEDLAKVVSHVYLTSDEQYVARRALEAANAQVEACEAELVKMLKGETPEDQAGFMANWLRGAIAIPDEVKLHTSIARLLKLPTRCIIGARGESFTSAE